MFLSPAILLSGYATPVSNMPDWLQTLTLLNPVRHFVVIAKGAFLKDLPIDGIAAHVWPLALIAAATLSAATWLFRQKTVGPAISCSRSRLPHFRRLSEALPYKVWTRLRG
jgi:ABC-2 type transport system permease protein